MLLDLQTNIKAYNEEVGVECVKMAQQQDRLAIAVCTPLMRRIHKGHASSGEMVFIDASGGMDRYDCRVFLLLTHSPAGGLPLACLITTSECKDTVTLALKLLKEVMPENAFFSRGEKGPAIFMTDDSEAERRSLQSVFPESKLVLCVFHVLQAAWRYVWEGKHAIQRKDRPYLLGVVKAMVYASTEEDLENSYSLLTNDLISKKYEHFMGYCNKLYDRRAEWACCLRKDLPMRGNNTNNYVEAAFRVLKDQIFERVRAYSPVQLLDFMVVRVPKYYERRLTDLVNGRLDMTISKRYLPGGELITADMINTTQTSGMYSVQSVKEANHHYHVDMVNGMCTCHVGLNGAPCKHQYAVLKHRNVRSTNFLPIKDEATRLHLFFLATGLSTVPDGWFRPLGGQPKMIEFQLQSTSAGSYIESSVHMDEDTFSTGLDPSLQSRDAQQRMQNTFDSTQGTLSAIETCGNDESSMPDLSFLESGIQGVADSLIHALRKNPTELSGAVKAFLKNFGNLKTDSAIVSALKTFGLYTGAAEALTSKKGTSQLNRLPKRPGQMIKVQPAALSRRTSTAVGGRRCLHTGRKTCAKGKSNSNAKDKLNSNSRDFNCHLMPKKRPRRAPHSLSQCVAGNENIGKSHSSKW